LIFVEPAVRRETFKRSFNHVPPQTLRFVRWSGRILRSAPIDGSSMVLASFTSAGLSGGLHPADTRE
jgi:hypothetical protein